MCYHLCNVCLLLCVCPVELLNQDAHGLSGGCTYDCLSGKDVVVERSDRHFGGVPCENLSLLLGPGGKKWKTCIADATGVTGRGYKAEREFVVATQIPLSIEEQAECVCVV